MNATTPEGSSDKNPTLTPEALRARASGGPPIVPFVHGPVRLRIDVAGDSLLAVSDAVEILLNMAKSQYSPREGCAFGGFQKDSWGYGGFKSNGIARPVTHVKILHPATGGTIDWPSEDPLPDGYVVAGA